MKKETKKITNVWVVLDVIKFHVNLHSFDFLSLDNADFEKKLH